jgi:hypothetical protein
MSDELTLLKRRILDMYVAEVLQPELGNGALRRRLESGLETVLGKVSLGDEKLVVQASGDLYERRIDYGAIEKSKNSTTAKFIRVRLEASDIKTYGNLAIAFFERKDSFLPDRLDGLDGQHGYGEYLESIRNKQTHPRGFGPVTINALLNHLDLVGFDYSEEKARELAEAKKNN